MEMEAILKGMGALLIIVGVVLMIAQVISPGRFMGAERSARGSGFKLRLTGLVLRLWSSELSYFWRRRRVSRSHRGEFKSRHYPASIPELRETNFVPLWERASCLSEKP
jgi:hypothetical protein